MATYEELMAAARQADKAGEAADAKRLLEMAMRVKKSASASPQMSEGMAALSAMSKDPSAALQGEKQRRADEQSWGEYAYDNLIGDPNNGIDSFGESFGRGVNDVAKAGGAGAWRGATALADMALLPPNLRGKGIAQDAQEAIYSPEAINYKGETTAGKYAGTIGEFLPGAMLTGPLSAGNIVKNAIIPGLASEGAGQATEGTSIEPYARVGAALVAPWAAGIADDIVGASTLIGKAKPASGKIEVPQIGSKSWRNAYGASEAKPTIESLRAAKNIAYKEVDEAGEVFEPSEMAALRDRVKADLDAGNYVSGVDTQTDAVVSLLDRKAATQMTLGQLDKLRQEFFARLSKAPNEVGIRDAIDAIDEMIAGKAGASELMQAARLSNSRYKKAELLDLAFQKARDQASATGSGGNIVNKMRQAVVSIIDSPKNAKWFKPEEIDAMRAFVEGSKAQNAMRLFGKLSPSGNGLMMALNLGAAGGTGGTSLLITGAAAGAKALADRAAVRGADDLIGKVAGASSAATTRAAGTNLPSVVPGAVAADQNLDRPDYEALWGRY